jgi:hypothetical protein
MVGCRNRTFQEGLPIVAEKTDEGSDGSGIAIGGFEEIGHNPKDLISSWRPHADPSD